MVANFKRQITHSEYKNQKKIKRYYHRLPKQISTDDISFIIEKVDNTNFKKKCYVDNSFMYFPISGNAMPFLGGG